MAANDQKEPIETVEPRKVEPVEDRIKVIQTMTATGHAKISPVKKVKE